MNTEDQLHKFKSKIYRESGKPGGQQVIVEGFSLFFDEGTRQAIKGQVQREMLRQKKEKMARKGHTVDNKKFEVLDDNQIMLRLLDQSEALIKSNKREQELDYYDGDKSSMNRMNSPYAHLKVKNLERVINYLRKSNDKNA
jgi:hypothetical protein